MKISKKDFLKSVKKHNKFGKKAISKWGSSYPNEIEPFLRILFELNYGSGARTVNCELKSISISDLKISEYGGKSRENIDRLKKEIKKNGLTEPILVDKNNFVKNGHHRIIALEELGYKNVIAFVPTSNNNTGGKIINFKEWI